MADTKPIKTLVEVMQETGWWPSDLPSLYKDPKSGETIPGGQVVVLEKVTDASKGEVNMDMAPYGWQVMSERVDSTSLPCSFKRYRITLPVVSAVLKAPTVPPHCDVLVAIKKHINPLTDCCALVPFDPLNEIVVPEGRLDFAQRAIVACLQVIEAWPYPPSGDVDLLEPIIKNPKKFAHSKNRLIPGRTVVYDPNEWETHPSGDFSDAAIAAYAYTHVGTQVPIVVMVPAYREKHPETINPYRDCLALAPSYILPTRLVMRLKGIKPYSEEFFKELGRAACAVHLNSLGAWPPKVNR